MKNTLTQHVWEVDGNWLILNNNRNYAVLTKSGRTNTQYMCSVKKKIFYKDTVEEAKDMIEVIFELGKFPQ